MSRLPRQKPGSTSGLPHAGSPWGRPTAPAAEVGGIGPGRWCGPGPWWVLSGRQSSMGSPPDGLDRRVAGTPHCSVPNGKLERFSRTPLLQWACAQPHRTEQELRDARPLSTDSPPRTQPRSSTSTPAVGGNRNGQNGSAGLDPARGVGRTGPLDRRSWEWRPRSRIALHSHSSGRTPTATGYFPSTRSVGPAGSPARPVAASSAMTASTARRMSASSRTVSTVE